MLQFQNLSFLARENVTKLQNADCFSELDSGFVQVQISGENKDASKTASNSLTRKHPVQYLWKS